LIYQAKEMMRRERERDEKMAQREKDRAAKDSKNVNRRRNNEEQKLEDDARRAYMERQSKL